MDVDEGAPLAGVGERAPSSVLAPDDPDAYKLVLGDYDARRQFVHGPDLGRIDLSLNDLRALDTAAGAYSGTFKLKPSEEKAKLDPLRRDGITTRNTAVGYLAALRLGLVPQLPLQAHVDDERDWQAGCYKVGDRLGSVRSRWEKKLKTLKAKSERLVFERGCSFALTSDDFVIESPADDRAKRARTGGDNISCDPQARETILKTRRELGEAQRAGRESELKRIAAEEKIDSLKASARTANSRAGTAVATARSVKRRAAQAELDARTAEESAKVRECAAEAAAAEAAAEAEATAEQSGALVLHAAVAQLSAEQKAAQEEKARKAADTQAAKAQRQLNAQEEALRRARTRAEEEEKRRVEAETQRRDAAKKATEAKAACSAAKAELKVRVQAYDNVIVQERAEFAQLNGNYEEAGAKIEKLEARISGLEKLTRSAAAETIGKLESDLAKANAELESVNTDLKSMRTALTRVSTQATQSQRAREAASGKLDDLVKETKQLRQSRDVLTETELREALDAARGTAASTAAEHSNALRSKDERIAALTKEVAELTDIARPPLRKFKHSDGSWRINKVNDACELKTLGLSDDNVPRALEIAASYWGVQPEKKKITVPACNGKPKRVEEKLPVPSASFMAHTAPLLMASLSEAQVGYEIKQAQDRLEAAGKDRVRDLNLAGITDAACKRGKDFFCMMLMIPGIAKARCASMVCGRDGSADGKVKKMAAGFARIGETMAACAGALPGAPRHVSAMTLSSVHALCCSSIATVGGIVTDRAAPERAAVVGEAMTQQKRAANEQLLAARLLASGQSIALIVRPASTTSVIVDTMPLGRDAEENGRIEAYLEQHGVRHKLAGAYAELLAERPPLAEESLAALLEAAASAPTAMPEQYKRTLELAAAREQIAAAEPTLDEASEAYRAEFSRLPERIGVGLDAALRSDAPSPLAVVAATLRGDAPPAPLAEPEAATSSEHVGGAARAPPVSPSTPEEAEQRERQNWSRHPRLAALGRFLFRGASALLITVMLSTMWSNCMEHALVNTFDAMGKELMTIATDVLGAAFLAEAAELQSGTKVKSPDAKKFRTGVWLFDSPIWHFIYRLCVYLSPFSEKDWAKGDAFIEWVLAHGKLDPEEKSIMKDFSAIHGSRNGVFWKNAIAIVLWRDRILDFLQMMKERQGEEGGKTRNYLIKMLGSDTVHKCLCVLAVFYLEIYLPVMHAYTTVAHVRELAPITQRVYACFVRWGDDPGPFLTGAEMLFAEHHRDPRADIIRRKLSRQDSMTGQWIVSDEAVEWHKRLFRVGARAYHHHHCETMLAPHGELDSEVYKAEKPHWDKFGGKNLNLAPWQEAKRDNMPSRNTPVERSFSILKTIVDSAVTRNDVSTCSIAQFKLNDTGPFYRRLFNLWDEEQTEEMHGSMRFLAHEREAFDGSSTAQKLAKGLADKAFLAELRAKAAAVAQRLAEERERLERVRVRTWVEFSALSSEQLLEQVRCVRVLDGRYDILISKNTSKKSRLETLVMAYALDVTEAEVLRAAGMKAKSGAASRRVAGPRRARPRGSSTQYEVEHIVGAMTHRGVRVYCVRWKGWPAESDEWVEFAALLGEDEDGEVAIHAELDDEVAASDAVREDELSRLAAGAEVTTAARDAALARGDRVVARRDESEEWIAGEVTQVSGETVHVQPDAADTPETFSRSAHEVLKAPRPPRALAVTDLVRRAEAEGALKESPEHPTGLRWYYGRIVAVDPLGELCQVKFDCGETYCGPTYAIEYVASAPATSR